MALCGPAWSCPHSLDFAPDGIHPAADPPQHVLARADPGPLDKGPESEELLAFGPCQQLKLPWKVADQGTMAG